MALTACSPAPVCNSPYILKGTDCCLDSNSNSICDTDETSVQQAGNSAAQAPVCNSPYILKGTDCCLDSNGNSICDTDEADLPPKTGQPADTRITTQELFNQVKDAVVLINSTSLEGTSGAEAATSSGFFISSDGYIVTNYHAIEPYLFCEAKCGLYARTYDKKIHPLEWVASDYDWDFAMLRLNISKNATVNVPYLEFAAEDVTIGDAVHIVGAPMGDQLSISKGIVSQINQPSYLNDSPKYSKYLQTDAAVNYGNSGGPFLNSEGEVVAMATFGYVKWASEGLNYGLQSKQITDLISKVDKSIVKLRTGNVESAHSWTENVTVFSPVHYDSYVDEQFNRFVFEYTEFKIRNDENHSITVCPKMRLVSYSGMIHAERKLNLQFEVPPKTGKSFKVNTTIVVDYPEPHFFIIDLPDCADPSIVYGDTYAFIY